MERFWDFAQLVAILGTIITGLILILVSLPGSRLREVLLKLFSGILFTTAGVMIVYVISPIDFIPDFVPLLGQVDDVVASLTALVSAVGGIIMYTQARSSLPPSPPSSAPRIEPPKEK